MLFILEDAFVIASGSSQPASPKLLARKRGGLGIEDGRTGDASRWRFIVSSKDKTLRIQNHRFDERFLAVGDRCVDQETEEKDAGTLSPDPKNAIWKLSKAEG